MTVYGSSYPGAHDPGPYAVASVAGYHPLGPVGKVRGTGICMLLTVVTLGIYPLVWFYCVHEEMKRHTGTGIGGLLGLLISFLAGVVSPFITSSEVGQMYVRQGRPAPVSGATGLWNFPGAFILIGPFVWFIKTNGALNAYWRQFAA